MNVVGSSGLDAQKSSNYEHDTKSLGYFAGNGNVFASIQTMTFAGDKKVPAIVLDDRIDLPAGQAHRFCIFLSDGEPRLQIVAPDGHECKHIDLWEMIKLLETLGLKTESSYQ